MPTEIVSRIENLLKEKIINAEIAWGGYSPAADFIATLTSGRKVFIKGTHPEQTTHGAQMMRQEIAAHETIPGMTGFSPAYLGHVSDGKEDGGWMLAIFDYIDAVPTLPWTEKKIIETFQLLARLHKHRDIPSSLPEAQSKNHVEKFLRPEGGWLRLRAERGTAAKFLTLFEDEAAAKQWLPPALTKLCNAQGAVATMGGARGLLHLDLRSDNVLFDKSGRVYFVDWPNVCRGPVALDIAYFFPSIAAESTRDVPALLKLYGDISGIEISDRDLTLALASVSGYMADNAYRTVPEKLPRLRWMQKSILWQMLQWATMILDIPPPPRFKGLLP